MNDDNNSDESHIRNRLKLVSQLKAVRKQKKMTLNQVAALTGIKLQNLSRLERGHVPPSVTSVCRYAAALGGEIVFHVPEAKQDVASETEREEPPGCSSLCTCSPSCPSG